MRIKGIIKEIYEIELEVDDNLLRREIFEKVEEEWSKINSSGFEDRHFSETDYDYTWV